MNEEVIENNLYPSATAKDSSNFEISYRSLFESARDGILLLDGATGKIIDVNPAAARLFDCSRDELLERKTWQTEMFGEVGSHIFREAREAHRFRQRICRKTARLQYRRMAHDTELLAFDCSSRRQRKRGSQRDENFCQPRGADESFPLDC
jgi:PAS domain S-box-containing protein